MFQPSQLGEAHSENQRRVARAVSQGERLIVVDNTNTQAWEMRAYVGLAVSNGYRVHIMEPQTAWKFSPRQLASRNTHNVPLHKIKEMLERYEKNLDLDKLLCQWNLSAKVELQEENMKLPEVLDIEEEDSKLAQLVADYSSEEEIFESDPEDNNNIDSYLENNNDELVTPTSVLNPEVPEFIPVESRENSPITVQDQDEERVQEAEQEQEAGTTGQGVAGLLQELRLGVGQTGPPPQGQVPSPAPSPEIQPDITQLLSMFPALSLGQLETLFMMHKGNTNTVMEELLEEQENTLDLRPKLSPPPEIHPALQSNLHEANPQPAAAPSEEADSPTVKMSLDPMFAVGLQELFGCPVDESLMTFFNTEELLEVQIPQSLAMQIFACWRQNLHTKLSSKPILQSCPSAQSSGLARPGSQPTQPPKTVLAPNAVEYYERRMVTDAMEASLEQVPRPRRTLVVVAGERGREGSSGREGSRGRVEEGLEEFIQQRDELYRKARASSKIQGVAGFYASEARELNNQIKAKQKEAQMELFLAANQHSPSSKPRLDLHYLQTGEAVHQLALFLGERQLRLRKGQQEWVEVVTGKGNRSDNGKSRLRPAVQNWLDQKNYSYSEVNQGCLKVQLKSS